MSKKTDEAFEPLPLPKREFGQSPKGRYRIYSDDANYKVVEATSALEALQLSGLQQAHRIQRDAVFLVNVLEAGTLVSAPENGDEAAAVPAAASVAPPAAAAAADVPPAAADAPLSDDQVNKLLDGGNATAA